MAKNKKNPQKLNDLKSSGNKEVKSSSKEDKKFKVPLTKKRKLLFSVILITIPILFFVLLEIALRLFNYGIDTSIWADDKGYRILNPYVTHRYFHNTQSYPVSIQDVFKIDKPDNTFRVFVLGESSAAGYPYMPNGGFSRYLQQRLEKAYPNYRIEIVNLGITAVCSYTIKDIAEGLLDQKPDLVIIYTGHNEYYGALGVGSTESFGSAQWLVNLSLYLNKFKTFQLLSNIISSIKGSSSGSANIPQGTLMARMAKEQYIEYGSEQYTKGIKQFENNMREILGMLRKNNIPVILGNLVCNLKDQKPFISAKSKDGSSADEVYQQANELYLKGDYANAKNLFEKAKDLDELRFRAPSEINKLIYDLSNEYNCIFANFKKEFENASPNGIVGNNLMTDHLHPNLTGFFMMGKQLYDLMAANNLLPKETPAIASFEVQDITTKNQFLFSAVDSVTADYRIKLLKNDFPYIDKKDAIPVRLLIKPANLVDTLAARLCDNTMNWTNAHILLANNYLGKGDYQNYKKEMEVVIAQFKIIPSHYKELLTKMIDRGEYDEALGILNKYNMYVPDGFSAKWLGIINLSKGNIQAAEQFLYQNIQLDGKDAQVYYNLAGVYINKKDYKKALEMVNTALTVMPNYQEAIELKAQLSK